MNRYITLLISFHHITLELTENGNLEFIDLIMVQKLVKQ